MFGEKESYYPSIREREREMLGRVRASPSPSPLDSLETPPSKIIKDDSFSIYEATLMKLKLGSQRPLVSELTVTETETVPEAKTDESSDAMNVGASCLSKSCQDISWDGDGVGEVMMTDTDCSSSQQGSKSMSILYMFSKFNKGYQRAPENTSNEAMIVENDGCASFSSQFLARPREPGNCESSSSTSFPMLRRARLCARHCSFHCVIEKPNFHFQGCQTT
ncbi:hypothetical protein COLO4_03517 [Corchorus olitorius]|uniref:Uncharacterized protein n=1 Tax=Corchorus olitorius TaxID=93759 RepID=A0A1R3KY50_9ROSI|nr:hypothetical protein COLO4_03517 [Corchorus olitorius]